MSMSDDATKKVLSKMAEIQAAKDAHAAELAHLRVDLYTLAMKFGSYHEVYTLAKKFSVSQEEFNLTMHAASNAFFSHKTPHK
jgi:hypothetical protein